MIGRSLQQPCLAVCWESVFQSSHPPYFSISVSASMSSIQVPQVFELVEEFVSEVAVASKGRLLLLTGEPGGGMFCLELDHRVRFCFLGIVGVVLCLL